VIVSTETGGLGNRIKSWVSAMRLDPDARVVWPLTPNMPAPFHDLFANDCEVESPPDNARIYSSWRLAMLPEDDAVLPSGFARVGAGPHPFVRGMGRLFWSLRGEPDDRYRYMLFPKQHSRRSTRSDGRHIDLEYGRIPYSLIETYRAFFDQIIVQPAIADRIDEWAAANLDADTIGVQVRTWRDDPRRQRKYHAPAVGRLRQLVEALPRATTLFVVSDSDDVVPWLSGIAGPRNVIEFPRRTRRAESWAAAEGIVEDLIDMLLLARTQTLFASYLSTFSETAWWLGGARAEVRVF
jgi:hypothetical protein